MHTISISAQILAVLKIAKTGDLKAAKEAVKSSYLQSALLVTTDSNGKNVAEVALANDHLKLAEYLGRELVKLKKAEAVRLSKRLAAEDKRRIAAAKATANRIKADARQVEVDAKAAAKLELAKAKVAAKMSGNKAELDAVVQRQKQEAKGRAQQVKDRAKHAADAERQVAAAAKARAEAEHEVKARMKHEADQDRTTAKASALQEANNLIRLDTVQHHTQYTKECGAPDAFAQKNQLQELCRDIDQSCRSRSRGEDPHNPTFGMSTKSKDSAERAGYVKKVRKAMKASVKDTDATIRSIASQAGCTFDEEALKNDKKDERLFEKADNCYGGDLSRVTDYKRRSLIAESFGSIQKAIKEINMQLEIVRIKNRFDQKNKTAKETGGYRDVQLLVKIKGTDLLLEVQLHIKGIHDLKTKVATSKDADGQTGHGRYIGFRNLKEAAELL